MDDQTRLAHLLSGTGRLPQETVRLAMEERDRRMKEGRAASDLATILVEGGLLTPEGVRDLLRIPPELAAQIEKAQAEPARKLGRFLVLDELGHGGMGIVYRAWQQDLQRVVALKVLAGPADGELKARFLREARVASRLRHPHIVQVHEYGDEGDRTYFAMDFIEGASLDVLLKPPGQPLPQSLRQLVAVARALHYAHTQGVIHRDIKPHNILVDHDGTPFLSDFGLAREVSGSSHLTVTGQIIGTPAFMSPEQAAGKHALVDARSDVYSLGAVLYVALTGTPPFQGETMYEVLEAIVKGEAATPSSRTKGIPKDLETICLKCLERDPARRYATAEAFGLDLERYLEGKPIEARPVGPVVRAFRAAKRWKALIAVAGALLIFAVMAALLARRGDGLWTDVERGVREVVKRDGALAGLAYLETQLKEKPHLATYADALRGEMSGEAERFVQKRADETYARDGSDAALAGIASARAAAPALGARLADVERRLRERISSEVERSVGKLIEQEQFEQAEALISRHSWMKYEALVKRIEAGRVRSEEAAGRALEGLGPDPWTWDVRHLSSKAWVSRAVHIDALVRRSVPAPSPVEFRSAPHAFGALQFWPYDFARAEECLDWRVEPSRDSFTSACGAEWQQGKFILRNIEAQFVAPLEGEQRLSMTAHLPGDRTGYTLALGGYFLKRRRDSTTIDVPSVAEQIPIPDAPPLAEREDILLLVTPQVVVVSIGGKEVLRRAAPCAPLAVRPAISADATSELHCSNVVVLGALRAGWAFEESVRQKAIAAVLALPVDEVKDVSVLAPGDTGGFAKNHGTVKPVFENGILTADASGGRTFEVHGNDFRFSRLKFSYCADKGLFVDFRVRAGFHEVTFRLPCDRRGAWRDVELVALDGDWHCRIDGHLEYWPVTADGTDMDQPFLRIIFRDGVLKFRNMKMRELENMPRSRGPWTVFANRGRVAALMTVSEGWKFVIDSQDQGKLEGQGGLTTKNLYGDFELECIVAADQRTRFVLSVAGEELPPSEPWDERTRVGFTARRRGEIVEIEDRWAYARHRARAGRGPVRLEVKDGMARIICLRIRSLE